MWPKVLTYPDPPPCGYPRGAEPFLAAIIADRDDDTPRLVFADWLQEQGDDERAEFIRLQIEMYRADPEYDAAFERDTLPPEWRTKFERRHELLTKNRARWLDGLMPNPSGQRVREFRRGFPTLASATPSDWSRYGERIRAWVPLEEVWILDDSTVGYAELLSSPTLSGLRSLQLNRVREAELRVLARSAVLDSLDSLTVLGRDIGGTVETPTLRALFGNSRLAHLRTLHVRLDRAGDTLGFVVGGSPHLQNMRMLHLSDAMRFEAAREVFDSPNVSNVTYLALPDNPIGDVAMRTLVRSKYLTRLETLDLRNADLTGESARLLAAWPGLRTITSLWLYGNDLSEADADVILSSPHAVTLTRNGLTI